MSEHFDPSEQETVELRPTNETPESAHVPDTNGDPEGSENRATKADIVVPDWFHRKFALDNDGKPIFNKGVVANVMEVFDAKFGTDLVFNDIVLSTDKNGDKVLTAEEQTKRYESAVNDIVTGQRHLLIVDPQSTGLNFLQLATRTWSEFVSVCYEYQDSMSNQKDDDIPDWLIEREQKMIDLGRKARMLTTALQIIDNDFGLKDVTVQRTRGQSAVEQRMQRLADWNFKQQADNSGKVSKKLNAEANAHMQSIVNNA